MNAPGKLVKTYEIGVTPAAWRAIGFLVTPLLFLFAIILMSVGEWIGSILHCVVGLTFLYVLLFCYPTEISISEEKVKFVTTLFPLHVDYSDIAYVKPIIIMQTRIISNIIGTSPFAYCLVKIRGKLRWIIFGRKFEGFQEIMNILIAKVENLEIVEKD